MRFPHSDNNWDLRLGRLECFGSNMCSFKICLWYVLYEFITTDRFFPDVMPEYGRYSLYASEHPPKEVILVLLHERCSCLHAHVDVTLTRCYWYYAYKCIGNRECVDVSLPDWYCRRVYTCRSESRSRGDSKRGSLRGQGNSREKDEL